MFVLAYFAIAMVIMSKASADRGENDSHSSSSSYTPEDLFAPFFSGLFWPIYITTYGSYRFGLKRGKKVQELNAKNAKLLRDLAPHMDEVEKLLLNGRR